MKAGFQAFAPHLPYALRVKIYHYERFLHVSSLYGETALLLDSLAHLAVGEAGFGRVAATLSGSGPWSVSFPRSGQSQG